MIGSIGLLIVGFLLLIKGADIFVDGASNVAKNFKIPKIIIISFQSSCILLDARMSARSEHFYRWLYFF